MLTEMIFLTLLNWFQHAADNQVKVFIDAEQTYFQPAIQRILGVDSMERFNKSSVNVLVTYQTYLKVS